MSCIALLTHKNDSSLSLSSSGTVVSPDLRGGGKKEQEVKATPSSPQHESAEPQNFELKSMHSTQDTSQASYASPSSVNQTVATVPTQRLTTKRSLWNMLRGSQLLTLSSPPTSTSEEEEQQNTDIDPSPSEESRQRHSFITFSNLNAVWPTNTRRHTMTAGEKNEAMLSPIGASSAERSLDGSIRLPYSANEAKLAEEAIRFADARHIIKTEQDINSIRDLADRLEQGWREKQSELAEIRAKLGEARLHVRDLQDENKHLRSQLHTMTEHIVAREQDFEKLQQETLDQSLREREIWESEKQEEVEAILCKLREADAKLQERLEYSTCYETDEEQDERDMVLFSANTSIDGDFFPKETGGGAIQGAATDVARSTSPTTPTSQFASEHAWARQSGR
ncbi:hypothetical protein CBS101457_001298 [Exobasidium rhododendri]|nr:hypothetical protein CBS101457_001298 [Exobasidium rhododendri]